MFEKRQAKRNSLNDVGQQLIKRNVSCSIHNISFAKLLAMVYNVFKKLLEKVNFKETLSPLPLSPIQYWGEFLTSLVCNRSLLLSYSTYIENWKEGKGDFESCRVVKGHFESFEEWRCYFESCKEKARTILKALLELFI